MHPTDFLVPLTWVPLVEVQVKLTVLQEDRLRGDSEVLVALFAWVAQEAWFEWADPAASIWVVPVAQVVQADLGATPDRRPLEGRVHELISGMRTTQLQSQHFWVMVASAISLWVTLIEI